MFPTAGDMAGSLNSNAIDLNQQYVAAIQAVFTGAPVGTFKLQISNDSPAINPGSVNKGSGVVNWTDYTGSSQAISAAGNFSWLLADIGYRWVRLVYTRSSGTGSLTAAISSKG